MLKTLNSDYLDWQDTGGGGGRDSEAWTTPSSQLPIRNLLFYDVQTWWLFVFILWTRSDQILPKLISQGVAAALFSLKHSKNFEKAKLIFLCLKIVEIDIGGWGGQFWVEKNDYVHKNSFFKVKSVLVLFLPKNFTSCAQISSSGPLFCTRAMGRIPVINIWKWLLYPRGQYIKWYSSSKPSGRIKKRAAHFCIILGGLLCTGNLAFRLQ